MTGKFIISVVCTALTLACSDPQPAPEGSAPVQQPTEISTPFAERAQNARTSPPAQRLSMEKFFANIYLPAYEEVGRKNPKWDHAARVFLGTLSSNLGPRTEALQRQLHVAIDAVEKAGCTDPLVNYMILRLRYNSRVANAETTNRWVQAANNLENTGYHLYWKFFSRLRAAQAMRAEAIKTKREPPEVQAMFNESFVHGMTLLKDQSIPTDFMYNIVDELILHDVSITTMAKWAIENIEPLLIDGWGDTAEAWYCIGRFHISYAWKERGGGWADTVTEQGWKAMSENLGNARVALEKSWNIKPLEDTGIQMLTVERGDSRGRPAMETWFNRVMWMNPASYNACNEKLTWLLPKWHGSVAEVLAFGHQCITNTAWQGTVPLTLYSIHHSLAPWYRQSAQGTEEEYWLLPHVWPDVKASFERFFELNPNNVTWRHNYALTAYKCRAWSDLRAQLKLLGPISHEFFGGKEAFEKMVADAEKHI